MLQKIVSKKFSFELEQSNTFLDKQQEKKKTLAECNVKKSTFIFIIFWDFLMLSKLTINHK